jgi:hypothetical protein
MNKVPGLVLGAGREAGPIPLHMRAPAEYVIRQNE